MPRDSLELDKLVANKLSGEDNPIKDMAPSVGEHLILQTFGKIKAKPVVFIGVTKLVLHILNIMIALK